MKVVIFKLALLQFLVHVLNIQCLLLMFTLILLLSEVFSFYCCHKK